MNSEPRWPGPRVAADQERADNTARSLSKILQAVQPGEVSDAAPQPSPRKSMNGTQQPAPDAETTTTAIGGQDDASKEFGEAPNSLGTLSLVTAYIVAALAFTGVTYIRSIVWLYQGVIGYPILLAIMTVTLALFIVPPVMIFRKTSALPVIDVPVALHSRRIAARALNLSHANKKSSTAVSASTACGMLCRAERARSSAVWVACR